MPRCSRRTPGTRMRPPPKTTHLVTELVAVTASRSPLWPRQTWSNLSFDNRKPSRGRAHAGGHGNRLVLARLTGNRTAELRPANISWLCLDSVAVAHHSSVNAAAAGAMCVASRDHRELAVHTRQQVIPRFDKGPGSCRLEPRGQRVDVDARGFELRQRGLRVAAIDRDRLADPTMVVEGPQRRLGHRVDRVRRAQTVDVHRVG